MDFSGKVNTSTHGLGEDDTAKQLPQFIWSITAGFYKPLQRGDRRQTSESKVDRRTERVKYL